MDLQHERPSVASPPARLQGTGEVRRAQGSVMANLGSDKPVEFLWVVMHEEPGKRLVQRGRHFPACHSAEHLGHDAVEVIIRRAKKKYIEKVYEGLSKEP